MDWTQAFAIMGVFIAAFLYMMSRQDSTKKELSEKLEANQKGMNEKLDSNQKQNNEKFDGMNQRFNSLENRMTGMESEMKATNQRIDNTNQRIDGMNQRITDLKTDLNQRLSTIEGYLVPRKVFHFEDPKPPHKDEPKEN